MTNNGGSILFTLLCLSLCLSTSRRLRPVIDVAPRNTKRNSMFNVHGNHSSEIYLRSILYMRWKPAENGNFICSQFHETEELWGHLGEMSLVSKRSIEVAESEGINYAKLWEYWFRWFTFIDYQIIFCKVWGSSRCATSSFMGNDVKIQLGRNSWCPGISSQNSEQASR